ncbi:MAG: UbiA family prenyltransferase [Desulfatibacillum sp.]|nr:UbiA family prenyltransferase [Desulfatibacillum sp.]
MRRIFAYLQLFRPDAALISFATFLVGAELAGGIDLSDLLAACCITGFSTNFCYSFNSWADWEADSINKPHRPIPSGKLSPRQALVYSLVLLVLSLVYPFFIANSGPVLFAYLLLPVLGFSYSSKPFSLKLRPPASIFAVSGGLIIPIMVGYYSNISTHGPDLRIFFVSLFIYCLSIIPLKDIEDMRGDGDWNLYTKYGGKLPYYALAGLVANALIILLFPTPFLLRGGLLLLFIFSSVLILWHLAHPDQMSRLYRRIIHIVEMGGALFLGWQVLYNKGIISLSLLGGG